MLEVMDVATTIAAERSQAISKTNGTRRIGTGALRMQCTHQRMHKAVERLLHAELVSALSVVAALASFDAVKRGKVEVNFSKEKRRLDGLALSPGIIYALRGKMPC